MEKYKDSTLPVDERVEDLLGRMTLREKAGQLNQHMFGWNAYRKRGDGSFELTDEFKEHVALWDGIGALYGLFRADPWSRVTYRNGIPRKDSAKVANMIQKYLVEQTRLGIPAMLSEECPHGHQALDGTLLPTNIGVGSTWNPDLISEAYGFVAAEVRARGGHLALVSALDVLREPRWGRAEECYGEDPYHAAAMTEAVVKGVQGERLEDLRRNDKMGIVLKHFCAQGACEGGHNAWPAHIGEREVREIHMPAMKAGVTAGAVGCMAAYNEIDGVPCHANPWLLTDVLRGEWGFEGLVMADGTAIDRLLPLTGSYEGAAALALTSGVDLSLWDRSFTKLEAAAAQGLIREEEIDQAVRRVLRVKFLLGLFEHPYTDESLAIDERRSEQFRILNLQVARESVVLLKNHSNLLPLQQGLQKIAVIGPNADQFYNQLGDYTPVQREGAGLTILEGIREAAPETAVVSYARGCGIRSLSKDGFDEAISLAAQSDAAVLVMGGSSARHFDIQFDTNGAAIVSEGNPSEMDCGEGIDVADLRLGGVQEELIREIAATGTPIVLVLIQGRPHALGNVAELCDAILCGWYPGQEGGRAIGEILFGKINPSGKLSVSIPRSSAQLPVYYNHKEMGRERSYMDMEGTAQFPFGFGLSYTSFCYSNIRLNRESISLEELEAGEAVEVSVDIENSGLSAGMETAQLYIKDLEASITRRVKELKGFKKIRLEPGEKQTVTFRIGKEQLAIWDRRMNFVVEPGRFKAMAGPHSQETLEIQFRVTK